MRAIPASYSGMANKDYARGQRKGLVREQQSVQLRS